METIQMPALETGPLKTSEVLKFVNQMYETMLNQYTLVALKQELQTGVYPTDVFDQKLKLKAWRDHLLTSLPSDVLAIRIDIQVEPTNLVMYEAD